MKAKLIIFCIFATIMASCSPSVTYLTLDMQMQSYTMHKLAGKSLAIAYDFGKDRTDSIFLNCFAQSFAGTLESKMNGGKQSINLYRLPEDKSAYYNTKDGLLSLVMELECDVAFHLPNPCLYDNGDVVQYIYLYDSKDPSDKLSVVKKLGNIPEGVSEQEISTISSSLGVETGYAFSPIWAQENFPIFEYYNQDWINAYDAAYKFDWQSAIDIWLRYTRNNYSNEMRSKAAYNVALGCFFTGQNALAKEWLSMSDKLLPLTETKQLLKIMETYGSTN